MIKKTKAGWALYTSSGSRKLGTHSSRASAVRQERAIQASKHARGKGRR